MSRTDDQKDAREAITYLVAPESVQYIAIMEVLEASVTDLSPGEVASRMPAEAALTDESLLEARLEQLREWGAVSKQSDNRRLLRAVDLLARNWRYTATPLGRHVQRFYKQILAGGKIVREIPLTSLARLVEMAESLAHADDAASADRIGLLFVSHDDLDGALVGAEDSLASLVDRFDLNDAATAELKTLLVNYATHVAAELERGSARVHRALMTLRPRFAALAAIAVEVSEARDLILRGALNAARGGRLEDWEALLAWCNPDDGRAARFSMRLVRALPGMHANLRRLHSSSGTATSRGRLLALAKACLDPTHGPSILLAALGDHPWRKLYGATDDVDLTTVVSWRGGPHVEVPELLRLTGRGGARGRAPAARDDSAARAAVAADRQRRAQAHADAINEVLCARPGATLSDRAARIALAALMAATRGASTGNRRTGTHGDLACTLIDNDTVDGQIVGPDWYVVTPGRVAMFHRSGTKLAASESELRPVRVTGGAP